MTGGSWQGREQSRRTAMSVSVFDPRYEPAVALVRGRAVESVHRAALAVVSGHGTLVGAMGDPGTVVLLRSTAKPFQAAAAVAAGVAEAFSLTDEELAVMAASHLGSSQHVAVVRRLLSRAGLPASSLVCGSVEHMCSGKHAGMLLLAHHLGAAGEGYQLPEHPVQREIRAYVGSLLQRGPRRPRCTALGAADRSGSSSLFAGTDGCGVPVLGMSLIEAAWLFALLAAGATPALARVRDAMRAHPLLVAGQGRLDTNLMGEAPGRVVCKGGAEGVQGIGVLAGGAEGAPLGCVMKIEDGAGRPVPILVSAFLRAWSLDTEAAAVDREHPAAVRDQTGAVVGGFEPLPERSTLRRTPHGNSAVVAPTGDDGSVATHTGDGRGTAGLEALTVERPSRWPGRRRGQRLTVSRGDDKDVVRFLGREWPDVDRQYFGRTVEWTAEPYALVFRRGGKVTGVLRAHFVGGMAAVDELLVAGAFRGRGLGSLLLGHFEEEARRRHCFRIVLRAVKGTPAEDFYRKRGYHRECVQYGYEFGYDYVRLTCNAEQAPGGAGGPAGESKGEA